MPDFDPFDQDTSPSMTDARFYVKRACDTGVTTIGQKLIYHYTSAEALHKIITTQSFWSTSIAYMNDTNEGKDGSDIAHNVFESIRRGLVPADYVFNSEPWQASSALKFTTVTCFSELKDAITQWQEYGQRGHGYSVGFDVTLLIQWLSLVNGDPLLGKVTYDILKQGQVVFDALRKYAYDDDINSKYQHDRPAADHDIAYLKKVDERMWRVIFLLSNLLPLMKRDEFEHEREWRIVNASALNPPKLFYARRDLIVPYTRLEANTSKLLPIKEIIIGPCVNGQKAITGLNWLLASKGYSKNDVVISKSERSYDSAQN